LEEIIESYLIGIIIRAELTGSLRPVLFLYGLRNIGRIKTKGGLLEIYLSLSGGSIENVVITGDFFSTTQDINRIENALKWASAREDSIGEKLSQVWRDNMIYGVDVPTLTRAILLAKENQVRL
jgi:lipoate-protein ligase A